MIFQLHDCSQLYSVSEPAVLIKYVVYMTPAHPQHGVMVFVPGVLLTIPYSYHTRHSAAALGFNTVPC